jgi:SET domain-containing protein
MPEIAVRESHIGGLGVFTMEHLRAGQVVREFKLEREITPESPLRPDQGERPEHCPLIDGRFYLVGVPDRYFNHSCDPNVYLRFEANRIDVVSRREIEAGCELTLDYLINNPGGDRWPCHCGAPRCRGETAHSFFTLPEELQREYLPLLAPWFLRRYSQQLEHLTGGAAV